MPDETKSNLEPIEESDLNLKEKLVGGLPKVPTPETEPKTAPEISPEKAAALEKMPEKKVERIEGQAKKEEIYNKILSKVTSPKPVIHGEISTDAATTSVEQDSESKIGNLVKLAEVKGVPHAVKVARHLEDNYVLDEFHDRLLSEELHKALVEKGMIKEI
jgi:hypothetical protein